MSGSEFCEFIPDDPACQAPQEPEPEAEAGPGPDGPREDEMKGEDDDMEEYDEEDLAEMRDAQIAFLLVSGLTAAASALDIFMYKWTVVVEGMDKDGEEEDWVLEYSSEYGLITSEDITTPYWRYSAMLQSWGSFILGAAMFTTQLLSMVSGMASLNLMVWGYAGMASAILSLAIGIMMFMGQNTAWGLVKDDVDEDDSCGAECSAAYSLISAMQTDMLRWGAQDTAVTLVVLQYGKAWMEAQWMNLSDEEREAMEAEGKGKKGDKDDDDKDEDDKRLYARMLFGI